MLSGQGSSSAGWLTTSQHMGAVASTAFASWSLNLFNWQICLLIFGTRHTAISNTFIKVVKVELEDPPARPW